MFLLGLALGVIIGTALGIGLLALLKSNDEKEVYYYQIDEEWIGEEWEIVMKTKASKRVILLKEV